MAEAEPPAAPVETVPWSIRVHEKRRKAFRFQTGSDVVLLHQVLARTPWSSPHGEGGPTWDAIATRFKVSVPRASVDGRACRRRYLALLEAYRAGTLSQLRGAAGSPAVHVQREQLLARCQFLTDDYRRQKTSKPGSEAAVAADPGSGSRTFDLSESEAAEAALPPESRAGFAVQGPQPGSLTDPKLLLRQKELELEERRLCLEEQRFEQQRSLAERQMEMLAAQTRLLQRIADKLAVPTEE